MEGGTERRILWNFKCRETLRYTIFERWKYDHVYKHEQGFLWSIWTNLQVQFTRAQHSSYSIRVMYDTCVLPVVCANYIEQRWDVSAFTVLFSASLFLSFSLFLFLLPFNYFYFYLFVSLSFSVCLSSTICLSVCLSFLTSRKREVLSFLSSLFLSFSASREGGIGDGTTRNR